MKLTVWTYEGPPHVGAMRVATAMEGLHYVLHAPQGDTYADLLFTMIERRSKRPPVSYTTFQARDLGGDTANLFRTSAQDAFDRFQPEAIIVGASCTAELIQDNPGGLAEALGLRRIVERRNTTLLRVAREVMQRQIAALDAGLGALRPLTLSEVAQVLDLHESTVSRAAAGVSIATPQGTWQLRTLFGPQVGDRSAAAIRAEIAQLVAAENPARPLTDQAITEALLASGRDVARRTVAKYRAMLRIPPAGSRRRLRHS
jgi:hypothetical protein